MMNGPRFTPRYPISLCQSFHRLLPVACYLLAGCQQLPLAPPPPEAPPVAMHRPSLPASSVASAPATPATPQEARVQEVAQKLLAANPQLHPRPRLAVTRNPAAELSHTEDNRILISEGLVNACGTEGQLAAAVSLELAKWMTERRETAAAVDREANREPPPNVPIGRDALTFGEADQIHKAELAKLGYDRRRPKEPPAQTDPNDVARHYLRRAGYAETELQAVQPLLPNSGQQQTPPPRAG